MAQAAEAHRTRVRVVRVQANKETGNVVRLYKC